MRRLVIISMCVFACLAQFARADTARPTASATLEIDYRTKLLSKVLIGDRNQEFKRMVEGMIKRLSVDGDYKDYEVVISPSPIPNASIEGRKMTINLGLLAWCKNEDDLAAVIAHEMTHANPNQLKLQRESKDIDEILSKVNGFAGLRTAQQEEIRADLGAMERLIRAGYNPWAHHAFQKRIAKFASQNWDVKLVRALYAHLFRGNFDFLEDHPSSEIRMEAAVQYLYYADHKDHLRGYAKRYTPFSFGMKRVKATMRPITELLLSPHVVRGVVGWEALSIAGALGLGDQLPVMQDINEVVRSTNGVVFGALDRHLVDPVFRATLDPLLDTNSSTAGDRFYKEALGVTIAAGVGLTGLMIHSEYRFLDGAHQLARAAEKIGEAEDLLRKMTKQKRPFELASFGDLFFLMERIGANLEGGYDEPFIRAHPHLTRASRSKRRALRLHRQVLNALSETLATMAPEELRRQHIGVRDKLNAMRPFVYEDEQCEAIAVKIADQLRVVSSQLADDSLKMNPISLFEFRVRTRQRLKQLSRLSTVERIDLVRDLQRAKLMDSAIGVVVAHYDAMAAFVWSAENNDVSRTKVLEQVAEAAMSRGTLNNVGRLQKFRWRQALLLAKLRQVRASAADKMPLRSMERQVARTYPRLDVMHHLMMRGDRIALRAFLSRSFRSVSELSQWVEQEVMPKNVVLDHFREDFYQVLVAHPQWLKTPQDVDALLKTECFWPTFDERATPTDIEKRLWDALSEHREKYQTHWQYDPGKADVLHQLVMRRLTQLGQMPTSFSGKLNLFHRLTDRGLTATSDGYFAALHADTASTQEIEALTDRQTSERVWEPQLRGKITREKIRLSQKYQALLAETDPNLRSDALRDVIWAVKDAFPERGIAYMDLLEDLSAEIHSTEDESARIAAAKEIPASEKSADFTLRSLSAIGEQALSWSKREQWELILFLRGDIDATSKIESSFRIVGPERVRRSFLLLPEGAKTAVVHGFIASPRGLLPDVNLRAGYSKKIIQYLLRDADAQTRNVAIEVLDAFMYALGQVGAGKENYRSLLIANLLAHPRDAKRRAGHILKDVLEQFGTTGIKIGQFLAAAEILPPEDTEILRDLQNNALPPQREHIYQDLRELAPRLLRQYQLKNLLGSASMKYGVRAVNVKTGEQRALKVLREGAIAHTDLEFDVLHHMSERLAQRDRARYGVFRAMAKASVVAVKRELSLADEVTRSRIAAQEIYGDKSSADLIVQVPESQLVNARIIDEEFAEGVAVHELAPAHQQPMAEALVAMERDILWGDKPVIHYDPDRHAKNYCTRVQPGACGDVGVIAPIDFGQVQHMTRAQRDGVLVELFALAQVLRGAGATHWTTAQVGHVLKLTPAQRAKLQKNLKVYFVVPEKVEYMS